MSDTRPVDIAVALVIAALNALGALMAGYAALAALRTRRRNGNGTA